MVCCSLFFTSHIAVLFLQKCQDLIEEGTTTLSSCELAGLLPETFRALKSRMMGPERHRHQTLNQTFIKCQSCSMPFIRFRRLRLRWVTKVPTGLSKLYRTICPRKDVKLEVPPRAFRVFPLPDCRHCRCLSTQLNIHQLLAGSCQRRMLSIGIGVTYWLNSWNDSSDKTVFFAT